jgi:hypothetical protein
VPRVRVWVPPDLKTEHFSDPPTGDQVTRIWAGETLCGLAGELRWIHWEVIDEGATCEACAAIEGTYKPALEGDYPGPP